MSRSSRARFVLPVLGIAAIASIGINGIGAAATPAAGPALHLRSVPHVPIVLDPTPSSPTLVAATPPPTGGLRAASANATFVINWDTGFNNNPSAKAAFQYAVDQWANAISSPVPITIDAGFTALGTNVLGSAGPNAVLRDFAGAPLAHTWFPVALANSLTATDLDPAVADIGASFSSNFAGFYFGTDGKTAGKVDFASVVMHEIGHGLGFIGSYDVSNGVGQICCGLDYPLAFDRFATSAGHALTDDPVPSAQLAGDLQNNQVQFTGAAAQAAAGGAAKLYSPSPWEPGSSYSHLDESTYPAGDVNSLMTPAIGANEVIHSPGPIALGIFADTGWNVSGLPVLSIGAQRVVEGNADTRAARFNVSLSRPVAYPVTFRYRTNSNTATSPTDFTALSGTGTIPAGTTSKTLNVTVRGDTIKESVERYYMRISSPVGATIGTAVATGGIIDDDPSGNPRLGIGNATIVEGDAGTRVARLTVALSKRPTGTVTVNWGTTGGSASPGTDYTAALGTITFQPGNTNRVIDIVIAPDITPEASETISVRLSGSTGAGIQRPVGVITITDDD